MIIRPKGAGVPLAPGKKPAGGLAGAPRAKVVLGAGIAVSAVFLVAAAHSFIKVLLTPASAPAGRSVTSPASPPVPPPLPAGVPLLPPAPVAAERPARPQDPGERYGDYRFQATLPDHQEEQYRRLLEEARAQPTNQEERSSLALTPERAERLKRSGNLVF